MLKIAEACAFLYFPTLLAIFMANKDSETGKDVLYRLGAAFILILAFFCICAAVRMVTT